MCMVERDAAVATPPMQRRPSLSVEQPPCCTLAMAGYSYPSAPGAVVARISVPPEMRNGGFCVGGRGCAR